MATLLWHPGQNWLTKHKRANISLQYRPLAEYLLSRWGHSRFTQIKKIFSFFSQKVRRWRRQILRRSIKQSRSSSNYHRRYLMNDVILFFLSMTSQHLSSYTTRHTWLITHNSSQTTLCILLILYHSSHTTRYTPFITSQLSHTTYLIPLVTRYFSHITHHTRIVPIISYHFLQKLATHTTCHATDTF